MSWRTIVITKRCKLETKLGYLICRGEDTKKILIAEISNLVIESVAVSLTAALICELIKSKVNIVFCDEKHNPHSQTLPLYGRFNCSGMLNKQLNWRKSTKDSVWAAIVSNKIYQQYLLLKDLASEQSELLKGYIDDVVDGDCSNREGHAAKVYFNVLFGIKFKRHDKTFLNSALNYGYSLILSAFNREIVAQGFNTRLGIAHRNEFNHFNLSCDLMEPFRVLVDRFVFFNEEDDELSSDYKHSMINIFNRQVKINGKFFTTLDAISIYSRSVLRALETHNRSEILFYEL